jgi:hypothetical protein
MNAGAIASTMAWEMSPKAALSMNMDSPHKRSIALGPRFYHLV